jgi:FkbM family methyltransferase
MGLEYSTSLYGIRRNRFGSWVWPKADAICWDACTLEAEAVDKVIDFVNQLGGGYIIQAGGNAGMIPSLIGARRPVLTFEPDWTNFVAMQHNLCERKAARRVLPIWGALTGSDNDTFILEPGIENNSGAFVTTFGDGDYQGRVLDDWMVWGTQLSLIWLDIEGSEHQVLKGGAGLVAHAKPSILIENDSAETAELLRSWRYERLGEWNVGNDHMWVPSEQLLTARRAIATL